MTLKTYAFTDANGDVTTFQTDKDLPTGDGVLESVISASIDEGDTGTDGGGGPGEVTPPV